MKLPSRDELLLRHTLYAAIPIDHDCADVYTFRYDDFQVDAHCVYCGKESIFKRKVIQKTSHNSIVSTTDGIFSVWLKCERNPSHEYIFYYSVSGKKLSKIGQLPSLEDVAGAELTPYRSALGPERFGELKRATGLFSHGIGIGAFVYLRRVFETLVAEHYAEWSGANGEIAGFQTMRMEESEVA